MSINSQKLEQFIQLNEQKKQLEAELEKVKDTIAELQTILLDQFGDNGMSKISLNGSTVFLKRQLWASAKDGDYKRACQALIDSGLDHLVNTRFDTNSLSSFVREQDELGIELPTLLKDTIKVTEKFSLQVRKSSKG